MKKFIAIFKLEIAKLLNTLGYKELGQKLWQVATIEKNTSNDSAVILNYLYEQACQNYWIASGWQSFLIEALKRGKYTIDEFKKHLEKQFDVGMTWNNYGEWEIDHIKPISLFNLNNDEELFECCNYNNLQPLWKKENILINSFSIN